MPDHVWTLRDGTGILASGTIHGAARERERHADELQEMVRSLIEEYIVNALSDAKPHTLTFSVEKFPFVNGVAKRKELTEDAPVELTT